MKLASLVELIVRAAPPEMLTDQMIYASLDFPGPRNRHLAIPEWHSQEYRDWEMQRHEFLTGEEEISGDILAFSYCVHYGTMRLHECKALTDAASLVLGDSGIFNLFTDLLLVFEHFRLRPYRTSYRDQAGTRVLFDGRHAKDGVPLDFSDRQIEWLDFVT